MKTFLSLFVLILILCSCQSTEDKQILRQLENAQLRSKEILKSEVQLRYNQIQEERMRNTELTQKAFEAAETIHKMSNQLLSEIDTLIADSVNQAIDIASIYNKHIEFINMLKKLPYHGRKYFKYILKEEEVIKPMKYKNIALLLLYQEILSHKHYYLGQILYSSGSSCGGRIYQIESSYFEYLDSSYINLHKTHMVGGSYYVIVDQIKQNGEKIEIPFIPEFVNIDSRIRLFNLDKGNYKIEGRVRYLYKDKLQDFPFNQEFEKK